jgi:hypothetical protein
LSEVRMLSCPISCGSAVRKLPAYRRRRRKRRRRREEEVWVSHTAHVIQDECERCL